MIAAPIIGFIACLYAFSTYILFNYKLKVFEKRLDEMESRIEMEWFIRGK